MVMASTPPMAIRITGNAHVKVCHLEDFDGRKFKTILPNSVVGVCVGFTCGYLVFFTSATRDFWLVNPITRKVFHFPDFPFDYQKQTFAHRVILIFSASISEWVLVVKRKCGLWFSIEGGKGAWWNQAPYSFPILDLCAFKGKIYALTYNTPYHICELRITPQPEFTLLDIKKPNSFFPGKFLSSGENLYVTSHRLDGLHELDVGEMKWVPCEEKIEEYAFFRSDLNHVGVAVKRESWADPRSRSLGRYVASPNTDDSGRIRFFTAKMWYFPHESMNVDRVE